MVDTVERNGLILSTGALFKPTDPAADKYRLTRTLPPKVVDLSQPRYLNDAWREPVGDQGQMGSCAAWSSGSAAATAHRIALSKGQATGQTMSLNRGWLYWHARAIRNFFGEGVGADTGSMPEDNLDLLRVGAPAFGDAFPFTYVADPTFVPPPAVEQAPRFDYVLNYRPFAPDNNEGGYSGVEAIWLALDADMPVVLAMSWPSEFFNPGGPGGCILPGGLTPPSGAQGHAVWVWGLADGIAWCDNQWTPQWTPNAAAAGHHARPGSFGIPFEYISGPRAMVWGGDAVSFEPIVPQPEPEPVPPEPAVITKQAVIDIVDEVWRSYGTPKKSSAAYYKQWGIAYLRQVLNERLPS